jgi:hypothetical protein
LTLLILWTLVKFNFVTLQNYFLAVAMRMDQKVKQRIFLSVFFFLTGICFSTWASRIPTIKSSFQYNDAELGTLLLLMPISSLLGLPISGLVGFEVRQSGAHHNRINVY